MGLSDEKSGTGLEILYSFGKILGLILIKVGVYFASQKLYHMGQKYWSKTPSIDNIPKCLETRCAMQDMDKRDRVGEVGAEEDYWEDVNEETLIGDSTNDDGGGETPTDLWFSQYLNRLNPDFVASHASAGSISMFNEQEMEKLGIFLDSNRGKPSPLVQAMKNGPGNGKELMAEYEEWISTLKTKLTKPDSKLDIEGKKLD